MSRLAAWPLYALLSALVLAGALLAAPIPAELGFVEEYDCAEFVAAPREVDGVRLLGCELDLAPLLHRGSGPVVGALRPDHDTLPPDLRVLTRRALELQGHQEAQWRIVERMVERALVRRYPRHDLTGDVTLSSDGQSGRITPAGRAPLARALGVAMMLFFLPALVLFWRTERRWRRAAERFDSGASEPAVF